MIVKLTGVLEKREPDHLLVQVGGLTYMVLVPYTVYSRVEEHLHDGRVELFLYDYIEVQQNRSFHIMIGFINELEREFFEEIIRVSGIGPKAAVKALNRSLSEIAHAIDSGDVAYLKQLPGIGLQRARNIVALLQGKMARFLLLRDEAAAVTPEPQEQADSELVQEAEAVLMQLQYRKAEARDMIRKALTANPAVADLEELLGEIYRQKTVV
jgi:Holliday junction DNA helicase RuvA